MKVTRSTMTSTNQNHINVFYVVCISMLPMNWPFRQYNQAWLKGRKKSLIKSGKRQNFLWSLCILFNIPLIFRFKWSKNHILVFYTPFISFCNIDDRKYIFRSTNKCMFNIWVSTLNMNSRACVFNNGYSAFSVTRGVRQARPLSPYLFILWTDVLSRAIIFNNNIKGIDIHGCDVKVGQYADDAVVLLDATVNSSIELFKSLNK